MKVAIINDTYGIGSTGRLSKEIADDLIRFNNKVLFIYAQGNSDEVYCKKICNRNSQRIHAILSRLTGLQGYFSISSTLKMVKILDDFHPDIVHLHNLHSNYINLKILTKYLKQNSIPTVLTLHDCWFFTGKCTYYVPANCSKWMTGCGDCPLLHKDNVNPTLFFDTTHKCISDKEKWIASLDNLVVVGVSDWVTNEAKKSIYKKKRICRIYNWIDQKIFSFRRTNLRKQLGLSEKKMILMVSTRLSEKKGYYEMLYLAKSLPLEYQLVYIGENNHKLHIPNNVIHVEHTKNVNQLAEYYSAADICVNTTQYETFGMVTIEAMSCGTPVVVYNNTASPELVGNGCGIVVDQAKGMDAIIEAIKQIGEWDRNTTRLKCIQHTKALFSKEKLIQEYLNIYNTLI